MTFVSCSVSERYVNPLFEVFDGGDFILSSYHDVEEPLARMRIFFEEAERAEEAAAHLRSALEIVGLEVPIETGEVPDEDWKFAYRRHFQIEAIGKRLLTVPAWELEKARQEWGGVGREMIVLDPGMAFGTGKHETTKACLEYIDEVLAESGKGERLTFLDMGCGSGILSIAAAKLGAAEVKGFDVDREAVDASVENAAANGVTAEFVKFALGRGVKSEVKYDLVAANILGPLLISFADEIVSYVKYRLILSGILTTLYSEVKAAYEARGFREISSKTIGEWTTGMYELV